MKIMTLMLFVIKVVLSVNQQSTARQSVNLYISDDPRSNYMDAMKINLIY